MSILDVLPNELLMMILFYVTCDGRLNDVANFALVCKRFSSIAKSDKSRIQQLFLHYKEHVDTPGKKLVSATFFDKWQHGLLYFMDHNIIYYANFRKNYLHGPMVVYRTSKMTKDIDLYDILVIRNWENGKLHGFQTLTIGVFPPEDTTDPTYFEIMKNPNMKIILNYRNGKFVNFIVSSNAHQVHPSVFVRARNIVEFYRDEFTFSYIVQFSQKNHEFPYIISKSSNTLASTDLFLDHMFTNKNQSQFSMNQLYSLYTKIVLDNGKCLIKSRDRFSQFISENNDGFVKLDKDQYFVNLSSRIFPVAENRDVEDNWVTMNQTYERTCAIYASNPFIYI